MFKSNVTVETMINEIAAELKAYKTVPATLLLRAYNTVILKLYRENIKEQAWGLCSATDYGNGKKISNMDELSMCPKFEDIVKIVVAGHTFNRVSTENRNAFDNVYYKDFAEGVPVLVGSATARIKENNIEVTYNMSPSLVAETSMPNEYIAVPDEFVGMIYSYVRSEGFKWLLETDNAAIWINDFNAQVVTFTEWINQLREPILG